MSASPFTASDELRLRGHGITIGEAMRQLELFRRPPAYTYVERPCTVGDGIERIGEREISDLVQRQATAAAAGRFSKFVPASGAATRMFKNLLFFQHGSGREASWATVQQQADEGVGEAVSLVRLLTELPRFAFYPDLKKALFLKGEDVDGLARVGAFQPVLDALLDEHDLSYGTLPKGLLAFHAHPDGGRTPFEEHLVEAADHVKDQQGLCRLHFTVSAEHREGFERLLESVSGRLGLEHGARFQVGYSEQKPLTDTLATDASGGPARDGDSALRFRPGGHGALIENLNDLKADLVYVKNIDNVQPDRSKQATLLWKKVLGGYLVQLQQEVFGHLNRLREPEPSPALLANAEEFLARRLHVELDSRKDPPTYQARRASLISLLNRPLRVCGVVPNTGEPGGGPFWVRDEERSVTLQIVETAQVDPADPEQQRRLRSSTHFNPVDLVCGVRDADGVPFDLTRFVDQDAVIITTKSEGGTEMRVLERPGLWNGSMARWNTVFVEVPIETFSPVKTVLDLLRPEHQ